MLLNLRAFASLVAGRSVSPLFTAVLLSFIHTTFFPPPVPPRSEPSHQIWCVSPPPSLFWKLIAAVGFLPFVLGSFWKAYLVRPPAGFVLASFDHFCLEILGRLIWLSKKKRTEEKARCRIKKKRESVRSAIDLVRPISSSSIFVFGKQNLHIWCAPAF